MTAGRKQGSDPEEGAGRNMAGEVSGDEAAWREIVARFAAAAAGDPDAAPWPAREDLAVPPVPPAPVAPGDPVMGPLARPGPGGFRAHVVRPAAPGPEDAEDTDDHFVPPPPPPLPPLDPVAKGAWAALFGGPAYLLLAVLAGWEVPGWAAFAAVAAFVGGFATLVVRMGDQPSRGSGPDDGAVV